MSVVAEEGGADEPGGGGDGGGAAVGTSLRVLRCPACAAPVPPGEGEDVRCPFCGAEFPLPAEYRELRDGERERATSRAEAQRLYRTLGRPPSLFLRLLARAPLKWIYLLFFPLVFVFVGIALPFVLADVGRRFRVSAVDLMTQTQFFALVAAGMFVTLGLPLALAAFGHRRANARRRLQAALAALPPERPGGPARCHACGAPLDVPVSAAGVACAYCGADNLVLVAPEWVSGLRRKARTLVRTIESAAAEERAENAGTRRRLLGESAGLFLLLVPPLALLGWGTDQDNGGKSWPPRWQEFVRQEPRLLVHQPIPKDRYGYAWTAHSLLHIGGSGGGARPAAAAAGRMVYEAEECTTTAAGTAANGGSLLCKKSYLVALRHGETLTLRCEPPLPPGVTALVVRFSHRRNGLFDDDWRPVRDSEVFAPERPAVRFRAPLSAWYRVDFLAVEEGARPPAVFRLSAGLGE